MTWACGWCIAFNDECCEGKVPGCSHGKRCEVNQAEVKERTEAAKQKVLTELRRGRMEVEMTGRIRKAWAQLDVATDEIVRLMALIKEMEAGNDPAVASFRHDLDLERAKAMGKAEILALIMPAPMDTPQAVSREAGQRWSARHSGVPHETPGLRMVGRTVMDDVGDGHQEFS